MFVHYDNDEVFFTHPKRYYQSICPWVSVYRCLNC